MNLCCITNLTIARVLASRRLSINERASRGTLLWGRWRAGPPLHLQTRTRPMFNKAEGPALSLRGFRQIGTLRSLASLSLAIADV